MPSTKSKPSRAQAVGSTGKPKITKKTTAAVEAAPEAVTVVDAMPAAEVIPDVLDDHDGHHAGRPEPRTTEQEPAAGADVTIVEAHQETALVEADAVEVETVEHAATAEQEGDEEAQQPAATKADPDDTAQELDGVPVETGPSPAAAEPLASTNEPPQVEPDQALPLVDAVAKIPQLGSTNVVPMRRRNGRTA